MANETLFEFFKSELTVRKDEIRAICEAIEPKKTISFHSWLTKALDGRIKHPSVHRVQKVTDWLRANPPSQT